MTDKPKPPTAREIARAMELLRRVRDESRESLFSGYPYHLPLALYDEIDAFIGPIPRITRK